MNIQKKILKILKFTYIWVILLYLLNQLKNCISLNSSYHHAQSYQPPLGGDRLKSKVTLFCHHKIDGNTKNYSLKKSTHDGVCHVSRSIITVSGLPLQSGQRYLSKIFIFQI